MSFLTVLDVTKPRFGLASNIRYDPEFCHQDASWDVFCTNLNEQAEEVQRFADVTEQEINFEILDTPRADTKALSVRDKDMLERKLSKQFNRYKQLDAFKSHNHAVSKTLVRLWAVLHGGMDNPLNDDARKCLKELKQQHYNKDTKASEALKEKLKRLSEDLGVDAEGRAKRYIDRYVQESGSSSFLLGMQVILLIEIGILMLKPGHFRNDQRFGGPLPVFRWSFMMALLLWCAVGVIRVFELFEVNYAWILNFPSNLDLTSKSLSVIAHIQLIIFSLPFLLYLLDVKFGFVSGLDEYRIHAWYPLTSAFLTLVLWLVPVNILPWMGEARRGLRQCISSFLLCFLPAYNVTFASNLLVDVITSFVKPLKDFVRTGCFLYALESKEGVTLDTCEAFAGTTVSMCVVQVPFVVRWIQCFKRAWAPGITSSERNIHLLNAGKYSVALLTIIVAFVDWEAIGFTRGQKWLLIVVMYVVSTIYSLVWDLKKDWSLNGNFRREFVKSVDYKHSSQTKSPMLYPSYWYMLAAFLNTLGRMTWATTLMPPTLFYTTQLGEEIFVTIISAIELVRRGIWTMFRLENEQVTNASGYRPKELAWVPPAPKIKIGQGLMSADDTHSDGTTAERRRIVPGEMSSALAHPLMFPRSVTVF